MIVFYDKMPDMECLAGDTLPTITVAVEADSLDGSSMQLILSAAYGDPTAAVICKECDLIEGGFSVTLTSDETEKLEGSYKMHFRFIGADGYSRRKLCGNLYVHPVPSGIDQEESENAG